MDLQLENIRKAYGDKQVLRDCTFAFEKGKYTASWAETELAKPLFLTV